MTQVNYAPSKLCYDFDVSLPEEATNKSMRQVGSIVVSDKIQSLVNDVIAKHGASVNLDAAKYWESVSKVVAEMTPEITKLMEKRQALNEQMKKAPKSIKEQLQFLTEIGYLEPEKEDIKCQTEQSSVDPEIRSIAGPQLVVPLTNARYALNAANSRWMSLYDCLYASNLIDADGDRAQKCVDFAMSQLDKWLPLVGSSWSKGTGESFTQESGTIKVGGAPLQTPAQYLGTGKHNSKDCLYFRHNDLVIEIAFDKSDKLGSKHPIGICDVRLESAITTIMDGEDSVAAVDEVDKHLLYSNWKDLLEGTLASTFHKNGHEMTRTLNDDIVVQGADGKEVILPGRGVLLARVVGLHIMTDTVKLNGSMTPETIIDVFVYGLIAYLIDVVPKLKNQTRKYSNSRTGSIYLVVPKMHGSQEVELLTKIFSAVESAIGAPKNTLKIGIMDEERRTSCNLMNCVKTAKDRVIFINTGFLDRTGDQISSLSSQGPVPCKSDIKSAQWLSTYEQRNVSVGLHFGLEDHAQIGKGMWPSPDALKEMYAEKIGHVKSGASTAWVPSPTGACIHAMHYHDINVKDIIRQKSAEALVPIDNLLAESFLNSTDRDAWTKIMNDNIAKYNNDEVKYCRAGYDALTAKVKTSEMESLLNDKLLNEVLNNVQCIVGYASRWIILGIGCSKIPNMQGVGLMEDRATLRISSQHLANWLEHGVVTESLVKSAICAIVPLIDETNKNEADWIPICNGDEATPAMQAIVHLCLHGGRMYNGYTEPTLYAFRKMHKAHPGRVHTQ